MRYASHNDKGMISGESETKRDGDEAVVITLDVQWSVCARLRREILSFMIKYAKSRRGMRYGDRVYQSQAVIDARSVSLN